LHDAYALFFIEEARISRVEPVYPKPKHFSIQQSTPMTSQRIGATRPGLKAL
jgi:hypothetical protein